MDLVLLTSAAFLITEVLTMWMEPLSVLWFPLISWSFLDLIFFVPKKKKKIFFFFFFMYKVGKWLRSRRRLWTPCTCYGILFWIACATRFRRSSRIWCSSRWSEAREGNALFLLKKKAYVVDSENLSVGSLQFVQSSHLKPFEEGK